LLDCNNELHIIRQVADREVLASLQGSCSRMIKYLENAVALPSEISSAQAFDKLSTNTNTIYDSDDNLMDCTLPGRVI
jgi:hypothetical protein